MKREDVKIVPMPSEAHKFYIEIQLDGRLYSLNENHVLNTVVLIRDDLLMHEKLMLSRE